MSSEFESLTAKLPKDLLEEFRELAFKKHGPKRGYVQESLAEAVEEWIKNNK